MANCNKQQLNITCGTDVVLHDTLIFDGETFDTALSVGITANLVSSLGKRTALEVEVADGGLIIYVPWVERNAGYYGLEVTGSCNSKKWSTYADSLIHYTRATEMGAAEVTIESDYYDITQVVGYRYSDSPLDVVNVSVDDDYGEPSVEWDYEHRRLTMDFHNLKGNGIVSVEQTTTSTESGGENIITFTDNNGNHSNFSVRNGGKGDTVILGDEQEYTLYNGTGDNTDGAVTQKALTENLMCDIQTIDFSEQRVINVYVSNEEWTQGSESTSQSYLIESIPGKQYKVTPPSAGSQVFFLTDNDIKVGETPHYAGTSVLPDWILTETILTAPSGTAYMCVRKKNSSSDFTPSIEERMPSSVKANMTEQSLGELQQDYAEKNILRTDEINLSTDKSVVNTTNNRLWVINSSHKWEKSTTATKNSSIYFPVVPGTTLKVTAQDGGWFNLEFLTEWGTPVAGGDPPFVGEPIGNCDGTHYFTVPDTATVVYLRNRANSEDRKPAYIGYVEYTYPHIVEDDENLGKSTDSLGLLYGHTIKPNYINGAWNKTSGYVGGRVGEKVSGEVTFDSNVEKVEIVNPYPEKVLYLVYYSTGGNPPYGCFNASFINRNFTFTPEEGVAYVIRMKADADATKEELDKLHADDYPYFRLTLKDSTLVDADNARLEKLIAHAKYFSYNYIGNTNTEEDPATDTLALLHYTDLHGDTIAAGRIKMWSRVFGKYIDDVLNTGDVVLYCASGTTEDPQGREWWQKSGLPEISLNLLGNHDGADNRLNWYAMTKDYDFRQYIEPYIESMGVTMPEGYNDSASPNYQACYWHKDYADQKIRLIGLDCLHRFDGIVDPTTGQRIEGSTGIKWDSTEQEEWLVERLNDCLTPGNSAYGYSVVIASHYQLDDYHGANMKAWADRSHDYTDFNRNATGGYLTDYKTGEGTNWQLYQRYPDWEIANQFGYRNRISENVRGDVNNVGNIIKNFMEHHGKFVVWLSGHVHCDMLYYPDMFPDILVCANTCAGIPHDGTREDRTLEHAAANYVVIDTAKCLLKFVRLGVNSNPYLAPINTLCYDYKNRKILFEE